MNARLSLAVLLPAFCLVAVGAAGAAAQAPVTDATVVAKVGAQNITRSQLYVQLAKYYGRSGVEQWINREVVRQEAARFKVALADTAVAGRLAELKKQGGPELQTALDAQGITDAVLRERIQSDLLAEGLLDKKWPVRDADLVRLSVRYARVQSERGAREIIQEAALSKGRNFEALVRQRSIDREEGGLVQPDPFLRIDNPPMFKLADDAIRSQGLAVGQITKKPIPSKQFWLVVRLERYLGAETLKSEERQQAVLRIRAARVPFLVPASRKRYKVERPVTDAQLITDSRMASEAVVARVSPPTGDAEDLTHGELMRFLMANYAKAALDQLVERSIITQQAAQAGASVGDAEVTARVATVKRGIGEKAFQDALNLEGITEAAWTERVRYTYLAEKTVNARAPLTQKDLVRLTARYIRAGTKDEADQLIRAARGMAPFEALAQQRSLDRGDHFIRPRFFLLAEQPAIFKALEAAPPGQVLPRAVEVAGSYYVLKLEARFGAETLSAKEREDAVRRINALRMGPLLDAWRKEIKVEYPVPIKTLLADSRA